MTPEQVNHVQDSFAKIAPCADTVAELFYGRLFSIAPEVRLLFPKDLSEQKKKLIQMLALVVTKLHTAHEWETENHLDALDRHLAADRSCRRKTPRAFRDAR
jgi:hemoglobin-like flavoprotein